MRVLYLHQPLRYDEAYSYLEYARFPWFITLSKYTELNNHIFHNLLMNLSVNILGNAEWAIRLPAFVAGCLIPPVTGLFALRFSNRKAAIWAGLIVACSTTVVEYSANSRGYSLLTQCMLLAWIAVSELLSERNIYAMFCTILLSAFGLWTVPTMLLPLVMLWSWLLYSGFSRRKRQLVVDVLMIIPGTLVLTCLLYLPALLVSDPIRVLSTGVKPNWLNYFTELSLHTQATTHLLLRDTPIFSIGLGCIAALTGIVFPPSVKSSEIRCLALSFISSIIFVVVVRLIPPSRCWLFMIPPLATFIGTGVSRLQQWCSSQPTANLAVVFYS